MIAHKKELTITQLSLWTGQQLAGSSPLYNTVLSFQLFGAIDIDHFVIAFERLLSQSDAMRTIFIEEDGTPYQIVKDQITDPILVLDWSKNPNAQSQCEEWLSERSQLNFDLTNKLFDAVLLKLEEENFIFFLNQHHLISDAWGVTVLFKHLANLYSDSLNGNIQSTSSLPLFNSFIELEAQNRSKDDLKIVLNHWKGRIQEIGEPPKFYGNTSKVYSSKSQRIPLILGTARSEKLRSLALEPDIRGWTLHQSLLNIFATVLAAFIYRVTDQPDFAIGTPAHNRSTKTLKNTPGVCIEFFPIISHIEKNDSFGSLLQKIRVETNNFLRNAVLGASSSELNRSYHVVLNYITASFENFNEIRTTSNWIHPMHSDPAHYLRLQVYDFDDSGAFELHFDLNCEMFDESQYEVISQHFLLLLDAFLEDRSQYLSKPPLMDVDFDHPDFSVFERDVDIEFMSIVDMFEKQVKLHPKEIAVRFDNDTMTFEQLEIASNQVVYLLNNSHQKSNNGVGVYLPRSPLLLVTILGILKSGKYFIPIPTSMPKQRIVDIIQDAQLSCLLTNQELNTADIQNDDLEVLQVSLEILNAFSKHPKHTHLTEDDVAYIMYTSGTTGTPKGVIIQHKALSHYLRFAVEKYVREPRPKIPLFSSIGFDLTITSLFLPLISGGTAIVYRASETSPDLSILDVFEDDKVDLIKLTPSHLSVILASSYQNQNVKTLIAGGEQFHVSLASKIQQKFLSKLTIYNEYGPTEATVGCVVHQFNENDSNHTVVPIGKAIPGTPVYLLDNHYNRVPIGLKGEIYIGGPGLAAGYWKKPDLTQSQFITSPFVEGEILYKSGDMAKMLKDGSLEYIGREDNQIKIGGRRVDLGEIENTLSNHNDISASYVITRQQSKAPISHDIQYCQKCGLTSNYPGINFNADNICSLCTSFDSYQDKVKGYFKELPDFKAIFTEHYNRTNQKGSHDCIVLLSGGKDSTYVLGQLVEMGFKVLAFTLDNGYISVEAKANIKRVVAELGVDHVFGETSAMNEIFVDSLHRHQNVCDGCFKTIYTLSVNLAVENKIPFIITGLSRGQFFETRLTEELFWSESIEDSNIDNVILEARKAYHQVDDAVKQLLDTSVFDDPEIFQKVKFIDFYRYTDVSLREMYNYLDNRLPWVRPSDTGRSTNCLINKVGIYVHRKQKGYSNYAFPYSWDVRIGHKTRDAALDEVNEELDEIEVLKIMDEIGYEESDQTAPDDQLIAYYLSESEIEENILKSFLEERLPDYMIPKRFVFLDNLPLTENGKIDIDHLPPPPRHTSVDSESFVNPRNDIEQMISDIWSEILSIDQISVFDNFLSLGGHSLTAIRMTSRMNAALGIEIPLNFIFNHPTIASYGEAIEVLLEKLISEMDDSAE